MKIKSGFELHDVCGEHLIMNYGLENLDFSTVISLNESAAYLWKALVDKEDFTTDDMVALLTEEYEVDADTARADCEKIVADWRDAGLM